MNTFLFHITKSLKTKMRILSPKVIWEEERPGEACCVKDLWDMTNAQCEPWLTTMGQASRAAETAAWSDVYVTANPDRLAMGS